MVFPSVHRFLGRIPAHLGKRSDGRPVFQTVTKDLIEEFSARSASRIRAVCLSMNK